MALKILTTISVVYVIVIAIFILVQTPYWFITSIAIDDAFYYPVVAQNIARGFGSTYDMITNTNGYHPLWCWSNIPFQYFSNNSESSIMSFKVMIVITNLIMLKVWWILLKEIGFDNLSKSVFILLLGGSYFWSIKVFYSGMETALVVLFIGLTFYFFMKYKKTNRIGYLSLLTVSASLTFLSRLDSIFFIVIIFLKLFWDDKSGYKRLSLLAGLATFLFVVPYLVWNVINFSHLVPVSGIKKSIAVSEAFNLNLNKILISFSQELYRITNNFSIELIITLILVFFSLIFLLLRYKVLRGLNNNFVFCILLISAVLHFIYNFLFMSEIYVNWYQYFIYLTIFFAFAFSINNLSKNNKYIVKIVVILIIIINSIMIFTALQKFPRPARVALIETAKYAKYNFNENKFFGMIDSGVFRIVSSRNTIGLNGLIGDQHLLNKLSEIKNDSNLLFKLLNDYNVGYIVNEIPVSTLVSHYISTIFESVPFSSNTFGNSASKSKFCIMIPSEFIKFYNFRTYKLVE